MWVWFKKKSGAFDVFNRGCLINVFGRDQCGCQTLWHFNLFNFISTSKFVEESHCMSILNGSSFHMHFYWYRILIRMQRTESNYFQEKHLNTDSRALIRCGNATYVNQCIFPFQCIVNQELKQKPLIEYKNTSNGHNMVCITITITDRSRGMEFNEWRSAKC